MDAFDAGNTPPANPFLLCYNEARRVVAAERLNNKREWEAWSSNQHRRPEGIPGAPHFVYKGIGWRGLDHWLGKNEVSARQRQSSFFFFSDRSDTLPDDPRRWGRGEACFGAIVVVVSSVPRHDGWLHLLARVWKDDDGGGGGKARGCAGTPHFAPHFF